MACGWIAYLQEEQITTRYRERYWSRSAGSGWLEAFLVVDMGASTGTAPSIWSGLIWEQMN
jgi:hypothetical protein